MQEGTHCQPTKSTKNHEHMLNDFKIRFFISLAATVPILLLSPTIQSFIGISFRFSGDTFVAFGLSAFVFGYGGFPFLKGAINEIRMLMPGMMTLISLAIIVSFGYSTLVVAGLEGKLFFWELATLIDIMLLGHWIEMRSVLGASRGVEKLAALMPSQAHRLGEDGKIEDVDISVLEKGDNILVRPGEKVPADGVVIDGASEVNEAALTGESRPVVKEKGSVVIGGSVNTTGSLTVEVQKTGQESYLSRVVKLVEEALQSKSRMQDLANKAALVLTFVALVAGGITFGVWIFAGSTIAFSLERTVTVMVITCPHALGLAVPLVVAMMSTLGARSGLLIRNRVAFEQASRVDVIIFDKTGTLTKGEFGLVDIVTRSEWSEDDLLRKTAAVEQHSSHPLAVATVKAAQAKNMSLPEVANAETIPGKGVKGFVEGQDLFVGNKKMLEDMGEKGSDFQVAFDDAQKKVEELNSQGKSALFIATKDTVHGILAFVDVIRDGSRTAVKILKEQGFDLALVTGDNQYTADAVAKELGIDMVLAEVLPEKKEEVVKNMQKDGKKVAMVGDGINDAPALAAADVGIAIGAGTDVAVETADIILVKNDPRAVVDIVALSRLARRKMIQNLAWATGYNVIAIPLAAGVLYNQGITISPAVGAIIMSLSTVIVAINSRFMRYETSRK